VILWLALALAGAAEDPGARGVRRDDLGTSGELAAGAAALPEGFALSMPFPEGVEYKVSCSYHPCTWAHARTAEPDAINDYYALDLIRNEKSNGRGLPVTAAADGQVVSAGWTQGDSALYGRVVVLRHEADDGHNYFTAYAHLESVAVEVGQRVSRKEPVGNMGGSSWFTDDKLAPHVHFAVYRDIDVVDGLPRGGQSVRPEPIDGQRGLVKELVLVAGDGARGILAVTVDDADPGFSVTGGEAEQLETTPDPWVQWSYGHEEAWTGPEGYGPWARVTTAPSRPEGQPALTGRWQAALTRPGSWKVQTYAPRSPGATAPAARYRVSVGGQTRECPLDQSAGQGAWVDLCGGAPFEVGGELRAEVLLADDGGVGAQLGWDAVRFIWLGDD
jgi:hypothetical protein